MSSKLRSSLPNLRCHATRAKRLIDSQGVISTVSNGASLILGHLREYSDLSTLCGALACRTFYSLATRGTNMKENKNLKQIEQAKTAEEAALRAEHQYGEDDRQRHSKHNYGPSTSKAATSGRGAKPPTNYDAKRAEHDQHAGYSQSKNDDKRKQYSGPSNSSSDTRIGGEISQRNLYSKKPRRRYKRKEEIPFPELGKPGARDDPLRVGLSGASSEKYLKYLNAGIKPEIARKRIDEEIKARLERNKILPTHRETPAKRERESVTPKSQEMPKRMKVDNLQHTNKTGISYASALKITKVAVLPKDYPHTNLKKEELTQLEEAIVEEVTLAYGGTIIPKFGGIYFRSGHLIIDCESEETVAWIREKVPSLKTWKGTALDTRVGEDIPKPHVIKCYLPRSSGQEPQRSVTLLGVQNGLKIEHWKVLAHRDEGTGQVITIGIDDVSLKKIAEQKQILSYRFGKVNVQILKNKTEDRSEEPTKEKSSTSTSTITKPVELVVEDVAPDASHDLMDEDISVEEDDILDLTVLAINVVPSISEEEDLLKEDGRPMPPTSPKI